MPAVLVVLAFFGERKSRERDLLDCQAAFGEKNPSENRNINLISLDVAPKL